MTLRNTSLYLWVYVYVTEVGGLVVFFFFGTVKIGTELRNKSLGKCTISLIFF